MINKNIMMWEKNSINEESLTGEIPPPITAANLRKRINTIKYKSVNKPAHRNSHHVTHHSIKIAEKQTDNSFTNFCPSRGKLPVPSQQLLKRNQDMSISRPKTVNASSRKFRIFKSQQNHQPPPQQKKITSDPEVYHKQLCYFSELYEHLGEVLSSIRTGLVDVEEAISKYGKYIQNQHMSFIDDFLQNCNVRIKKAIRTSRIHECLSISYLFLEIAQNRMENNESYLVNFIGYSLSNLIFLVRVYILFENRHDYEKSQFHRRVEQFQIESYGHVLKSMEDVLFRIQHNNQIITLIHKKLGRENQKFEECVLTFLKNAERKQYSTCLCAHYIFQYLAMHIYESGLEGISSFLQISPTPYLPPPIKQYTLVIQPFGVLLSGNKLRPYLIEFMKWVSKHFQVILWTWEMPSELENLLELIQPFLSGKLFRYHCIYENQVYVKDLNRLGRKLDKALIIDFDERIFPLHPRNGFSCRWKGSRKDQGLRMICQILEEMLKSDSVVSQMLTFYAEDLHSIRGY